MKYPIYKVSRATSRGHLIIIAADQSEALSRAKVVWEAKNMKPLSTDEAVSIDSYGTVDYIPALPVDHIEGA